MIICSGITRRCQFEDVPENDIVLNESHAVINCKENELRSPNLPAKKKKKKKKKKGAHHHAQQAPSVSSIFSSFRKRSRRHSFDEPESFQHACRKKILAKRDFSPNRTIKSDGELDGVKPRSSKPFANVSWVSWNWCWNVYIHVTLQYPDFLAEIL